MKKSLDWSQTLNLYSLHSDPKSLFGYKEATERVPAVAWEVHENDLDKLREFEHIWAKSAKYSYYYAAHIIKRRFPKGESAIATDQGFSFAYAKDVLNGRFRQGEPEIARHPESYWYALVILGDRFPEGEPAIATDAEYSYEYAKNVLEKRFPLGEPTIRGSEWQESYEQIFGVNL